MKWVIRVIGIVGILLIALFVVAAVLPIPTDPALVEHGAGASSIEPSFSGLQREFPPINSPAGNPTTPEKVELGRLLFFDPVLSANNDIACADCHHPDLGFSDGRATAQGPAGQELSRNALTLWNVGYNQHLFWDGRVTSLEEQVLTPLIHEDEMGANEEDLVAELESITQYMALFESAFGGGPESISLENVQNALAAFERTLVTNDSPFDRYAAGDFEALTPQQRRGLALFRSGATRCFECHAAPTFATETFRVIGVPSDDPGRYAVDSNHPVGAFRVPTLRNITLTAPYMHNGSLATLEEVVEFYAEGGGRAHGMENVDPFVQGFDLNDQEKEDLVAFLLALTDESQLPTVPSSVPSGLPVTTRVTNPVREDVAAALLEPAGTLPATRNPMTITVAAGEPIQAAVDRARPGDTILVPYGEYHETVVIDSSDIRLLGIPNESGEWPLLDGRGELADGIIASGNNFEVGYFRVVDYNDNGVLVEGVTGVHFHDLYVERTGTYGVYPVQSTNIVIERVEVTGVDDAGIYAGQSENVVVRDSVVYGNVLGIELENTVGGEVYNNHVYDNSVGIFLVLLPNLTSKISAQAQVYDNLVEANNHENFAPEGNIAGVAPPGVGILILSSDENEVYDNVIKDNKSTGVAIFSLVSTGFFEEIDVGPNPENNWLHDNAYTNNGYDPDPFVRNLGIPTGDIIWDGTGIGNVFDEPDVGVTFPPLLPTSNWPAFLENAYWQALNFVVGLVS
jgi:parallel beta-helix repeat protein